MCVTGLMLELAVSTPFLFSRRVRAVNASAVVQTSEHRSVPQSAAAFIELPQFGPINAVCYPE
jgi:hypothetical protein